MLARYLTILAVTTTLLAFSACGKQPIFEKETMLDRNWGRAYESAKSNQILNPEASKNLDPVTGMDGQAAEQIMRGYRRDFKGQSSQSSNSGGTISAPAYK
jgi:hypothetical protein